MSLLYSMYIFLYYEYVNYAIHFLLNKLYAVFMFVASSQNNNFHELERCDIRRLIYTAAVDFLVLSLYFRDGFYFCLFLFANNSIM